MSNAHQAGRILAPALCLLMAYAPACGRSRRGSGRYGAGDGPRHYPECHAYGPPRAVPEAEAEGHALPPGLPAASRRVSLGHAAHCAVRP